MEFKHYYAVLGVTQDASVDDIKRAYLRLARKYHPDVSKESDAEVRFKEFFETLFGAHGPQADAQAGRRSAFQRIVRRRSRSRWRGAYGGAKHRLQCDLHINLAGAALALDLLEEIRTLKRNA